MAPVWALSRQRINGLGRRWANFAKGWCLGTWNARSQSVSGACNARIPFSTRPGVYCQAVGTAQPVPCRPGFPFLRLALADYRTAHGGLSGGVLGELAKTGIPAGNIF